MGNSSSERFLTPYQVFSLSFGSAVGWGAFVMPGSTFLKKAGPLGSFFAMQLAIFVMLLICYNYFYLIKKHPVAGGQYVYTREAFGRTHSFICVWFLLLSYFLIVPLNATAIFLIIRTLFGDALQSGFHYVLAGFDVYGYEVAVSIAVLIVFALIALRGLKQAARVQSVLATFMLLGLILMVLGAMLSPKATTAHFTPAFNPEGNPIVQVLSVAAVGPWAFIGFETVPQYTDHYRFDLDKIKPIMDIAVIVSGLAYILLALLAATVLPAGYDNWVAYIADLNNLSGGLSLPSFNFAQTTMGSIGAVIFVVAALAAITTGVLGSFLSTSQLLQLLAEDHLVPKFLARKTAGGVPKAAILFILLLSVIGPFFGRVFLTWVIDSSSIGAAIGFGYTSLAARKAAKAEGNRDMVVLGTLGALFSAAFAILLLIPIPQLNASLSRESYICLFVWSSVGFILYQVMRRRGVAQKTLE